MVDKAFSALKRHVLDDSDITFLPVITSASSLLSLANDHNKETAVSKVESDHAKRKANYCLQNSFLNENTNDVKHVKGETDYKRQKCVAYLDESKINTENVSKLTANFKSACDLESDSQSTLGPESDPKSTLNPEPDSQITLGPESDSKSTLNLESDSQGTSDLKSNSQSTSDLESDFTSTFNVETDYEKKTRNKSLDDTVSKINSLRSVSYSQSIHEIYSHTHTSHYMHEAGKNSLSDAKHESVHMSHSDQSLDFMTTRDLTRKMQTLDFWNSTPLGEQMVAANIRLQEALSEKDLLETEKYIRKTEEVQWKSQQKNLKYEQLELKRQQYRNQQRIQLTLPSPSKAHTDTTSQKIKPSEKVMHSEILQNQQEMCNAELEKTITCDSLFEEKESPLTNHFDNSAPYLACDIFNEPLEKLQDVVPCTVQNVAQTSGVKLSISITFQNKNYISFVLVTAPILILLHCFD